MTVILLLLKIIGIILLILLGILFFLISLVLFVPVRYEFSGELGDEKTIRGRIFWLFHLVNWSFGYEKENFQVRKLRICGIPLNFKKKKNTKNESDGKAEMDEENESEGRAEKDAENESEGRAETAPHVREKAEKGILWRIRSFFSKIRDSFRTVRNTLSHIRINVSDIKKQMADETNRKAVLCVLSELKYMLQHFGFRKIDTDLTFSLGDPATTGQILGILCMLPFLYRYSVGIYPDFEADEAYVRGNYAITGRIRLIHVLVFLIRLLKKQEVRILLNRVIKK